MKLTVSILLAGLTLAGSGLNSFLYAQSVIVTAQLDTNQLAVGQITTLRIFAQVAPNLRTNADQIFSWYVDVTNTNSSAALGMYGALAKTASDNDPLTSSSGFTEGNNRRGIYDTFLNRPGAGVSNAVLLATIPVLAAAPGQTRLLVSAGTGVSGLANDFLVAPLGGGEPWFGGDYSQARVDLTVLGNDCNVQLQIQRLDSGAPTPRLQLHFTPCPGRNHTVVSRTAVDSGPWSALPGAPHNSGSVVVTNTTLLGFFRVQVD